MKTYLAVLAALLCAVQAQATVSLDVQYTQDNWYFTFRAEPLPFEEIPKPSMLTLFIDNVATGQSYVTGGSGVAFVSGGTLPTPGIGQEPYWWPGAHAVDLVIMQGEETVGTYSGAYTVTEPTGLRPGNYDTVPVPEPSTLLAGALLALPALFAFRRR